MPIYPILQIRNVRNIARVWCASWPPFNRERIVVVPRKVFIISEVPQIWLDTRPENFVQIISPYGHIIQRFKKSEIGWREVTENDFSPVHLSGLGWCPAPVKF